MILLSDPSGIDLEWILPLVDEFQEAGIRPVVIDCTAPETAAISRYWRAALKHVLGDEPMRLVDFEPVGRMLSRFLELLLFSPVRLKSSLGAIYFSPKSPLNRVVFGRLRQVYVERGLAEIMKDSLGVFVGLRDRDWSAGSYEGRVVTAAKAAGVAVIGYPAVVDAKILLTSITDCDIALANTEQQARSWSRLPVRSVRALTPPKLTQRWLSRLGKIHAAIGDVPPIPQARPVVLLVLKNDNSIVWSNLDFFETAGDLISSLIGDGFFVLIKPHPRQTKDALDRLMSAFSHSDFALVEGALSYWASRADRVVSLLSGGVVDCLAGGKVAVLYWPMGNLEAAEVARAPSAFAYYSQGDAGEFATKYRSLALEVTNRPFRLPADKAAEAEIRANYARLFPLAEDCRELIDFLAAPAECGAPVAVAAQ